MADGCFEGLGHIVGVDVMHELRTDPGTSIGCPAESFCHTAGSMLPRGLIGGQPGPTMWPGWSEVVTSPPDLVSSWSIWTVAALAMPYSPMGGAPLSSVIGTFRFGPWRQMEPQ